MVGSDGFDGKTDTTGRHSIDGVERSVVIPSTALTIEYERWVGRFFANVWGKRL